jgi:hypothetical protein
MDLQSEMEHQSKHSGTTPQPIISSATTNMDVDFMCQLILDIRDVKKREQALLELRFEIRAN